MSLVQTSKPSPIVFAAACATAVGTALAVSYVLVRAARRKPAALVNRCLRAVDELERRVVEAVR